MPLTQPTRAHPRHWLSAVGVLLLYVLLSGCASPVTLPPLAAQAHHAQVLADDRAAAHDLAQHLDRDLPRLLALVPDTSDRLEQVVLMTAPGRLGGSADRGPAGLCLPGGALVAVDASLAPEKRRSVLLHELVHSSLGPSWEPLPAALEEGLGDWVSMQLAPENSLFLHAQRLIMAASALAPLTWELRLQMSRPGLGVQASVRFRVMEPVPAPREVLELQELDDEVDAESEQTMRGLGYLLLTRVVELHGLQGLHRLCTSATADDLQRVPLERVLAAADVGANLSPLRDDALRRLSHESVTAFAEHAAPALFEGLWASARAALGRSDGPGAKLRALLCQDELNLCIDLTPLPGFEAFEAAVQGRQRPRSAVVPVQHAAQPAQQ